MMRHSTWIVAAAAFVGASLLFSQTRAQQPANAQSKGPVLVVAGVVERNRLFEEYKGVGFKAQQFGGLTTKEAGFKVIFEKELERVPVVVATPMEPNSILSIDSVTKEGFRATCKSEFRDGVYLPGPVTFSFIATLP